MHPRLWTLIAPALLVALVASIAAGVQRYASPPGGLQLPVRNTGDKPLLVRTGSLRYPREAVDSDGFTVRIEHPAHRIVSQSWSIDGWVYAVAPSRDVVAVSESAYQQRMSNVYASVQQFHPAISSDPQRVIALDPDLMIVSSNGRADYTSLARSCGVPVFRIQTMPQTLDEIEQAVRLVGYITGNDDAAANEAARFHGAIQRGKLNRSRTQGHGASSGNPQRRLSCSRGTCVNKSGRSGVCVSPASGRVVTRLRLRMLLSALRFLVATASPTVMIAI
jgi:ABC-type Fe3+-hydroxamate transport system substrate-binding protein